MEIKIVEPSQIEKRSFDIISSRLGKTGLPESEELILKRVIHTTADFDYAENLKFANNAVESAIEALKYGCGIITDTKMALAGISKKLLKRMGCSLNCYISDDDVAEEASRRGITRASVSMEKALGSRNNKIFIVGNAPTALIKLCELVQSGELSPALIVGVPVGFVNVIESKELLKTLDVPYIVAEGNKGGSNVAAAVMNAIIYQIKN